MDTIDERVADYILRMGLRERTIVVYEDGSAMAWLTFFLLNSLDDIYSIYHTPLWRAPLDTDTGVVIYIDKLICFKKWSPSVRRAIKEAVMEKYPRLELACWHRPTGVKSDRLVIYPLQEVPHEHKV